MKLENILNLAAVAVIAAHLGNKAQEKKAMNSKIVRQEVAGETHEYSKEYGEIRKTAESQWPAWRVLTYNNNYATSAHARKVIAK